MRPAVRSAVFAAVLVAVLTGCAATDEAVRKPRPKLPGEDVSEVGWGTRGMGPGDYSNALTPMMSR
jgi:hypothetical protein